MSDEPTTGEINRRLDDSYRNVSLRIDEVVRQVGVDLTRHERRVSDLESDSRTSRATNDSLYVSAAVYAKDLAETRKDHAELLDEVRTLKTTLENNRRLVLTSLVLPILVALIVFFLTTRVST